VRRIAEDCAAQVAQLVVSRFGTGSDSHHSADSGARAQHIEAPADIEAFNDFCERERWSDGLPLIPPTVERVERMVQASGRAPEEIVASVAPGFGIATVERVAINAVMAGCRPEYLPVLLAAVQAVADRRFNLQGIQATTNPATPWIVVNGPIAREIGVNGRLNCLGQGTRPNSTIGRALRLVLQNIGRALPGEMDRATHGQPGKYTFCCAENEAESPWEPLHVERGLAPDESAVTVIGASGTLNMNSHAKDAEDLLRAIADSMTFPTSNDYHFGGQPWVILSPEHAEVLKLAGFSKLEVKRRLWEQSMLAASRFAAKDYARACHTRGPELGKIELQTRLPISVKAEDIGIIVAGGPGTHSVYVPTFGQTRAVTRAVIHRAAGQKVTISPSLSQMRRADL
jgi:hypothetical protein